MAFDLKSITRESVLKAPRILLIGIEKIGKTSFACGCHFEDGTKGPVSVGINDPIVISMKGEEGVDGLKVGKFPKCDSYNDVLDCLTTLSQEEHPYKTVVLDSASVLGPLINDDVCNEFKVDNVRKVPGFKTGEAACEIRWRNIIAALDYLRNEKGMASVIISHSRIKKHKNPEGDDYDTWDVDLDNNYGEILKRWVDLILFANTKVTVKVQGEDAKFSKAKRTGKDIYGGKRFLYTQKNPAYPAGGRDIYGHLPDELPLSWKAFMDAVAEAASK